MLLPVIGAVQGAMVGGRFLGMEAAGAIGFVAGERVAALLEQDIPRRPIERLAEVVDRITGGVRAATHAIRTGVAAGMAAVAPPGTVASGGTAADDLTMDSAVLARGWRADARPTTQAVEPGVQRQRPRAGSLAGSAAGNWTPYGPADEIATRLRAATEAPGDVGTVVGRILHAMPLDVRDAVRHVVLDVDSEHAGYWERVSGSVALGRDLSDSLRAFAAGDRSLGAIGGYAALLHEVGHARSPASSRFFGMYAEMDASDARDYARRAEEGVVEHFARNMTARSLWGVADSRDVPGLDAAIGGYPEEVASIRRIADLAGPGSGPRVLHDLYVLPNSARVATLCAWETAYPEVAPAAIQREQGVEGVRAELMALSRADPFDAHLVPDGNPFNGRVMRALHEVAGRYAVPTAPTTAPAPTQPTTPTAERSTGRTHGTGGGIGA